jgi:hypothetical protein
MPVEYDSVRSAIRGLGRATPELKRQLRPRLRSAGESIRQDMRARASYSTRIPGAIGMRTSFSAKGGGVSFRVSVKKAPHSRVMERGNLKGRHGTFRHPVFGDRQTWVSQPTRPYFYPALVAGRPAMERNITDAVRASLREVQR